jgi:hypothetical protein
MNAFRMVAVVVLLTGPAYAQNSVLIQNFNEKTPQQKADDELREKFSKESPKKLPESETRSPSADPWGTVRSGDAGKASISKTSASKTSNSKTVASAKPHPKTGPAAEVK